ncbi:hypothetical protein FXF51_06015 [Nonomuraea sp. PA05]|uniref:hypothetical protein n=1 Tax=Nonomuraea sp. PA05 TaxID=2604466 RepID=UPI0011D4EC55|nr:hypothetical protein [Nonomuraea sp. PA05]TYB69715.1 hypothetical protein FXF51_06015 [Nonomuraea sp. PA05]
MQDPPSVRLPHHPAGAGLLHQWRKTRTGQWEALVEYVLDVPGYKGGLEPHRSWLQAYEVEPIKGVDYSRVPRSRA